jgi:hypothetical protein
MIKPLLLATPSLSGEEATPRRMLPRPDDAALRHRNGAKPSQKGCILGCCWVRPGSSWVPSGFILGPVRVSKSPENRPKTANSYLEGKIRALRTRYESTLTGSAPTGSTPKRGCENSFAESFHAMPQSSQRKEPRIPRPRIFFNSFAISAPPREIIVRARLALFRQASRQTGHVPAPKPCRTMITDNGVCQQ